MTAFANSQSNPPFRTKHPTGPALSLTRRVWKDVSAAPIPGVPTNSELSAEAEHAARQMHQALAERERQVADAEARLAERARDLDELDALLRARESLITATRLRDSKHRHELSPREAAALHQLKEELEKQEASIKEARESLRERELYLEQSENRLCAKVQEQQEKEMELEQREENLVARAIQGSAPELEQVSTERTPAPAFDEFRE